MHEHRSITKKTAVTQTSKDIEKAPKPHSKRHEHVLICGYSSRMQYPPDDWSIKCDDLFGAFSLTEASDDLTCKVLVQVDRSARIHGSYQILLGGSEPVKLNIGAEEILISGGIAAYRLAMEKWPRDITFNVNSTASPWMDVEEAIAEKTMKVLLAGGGEDTKKSLRKQLLKESSSRSPNGAAFRWAVAATESAFLELQLQVLPLPAATINAKPILLQDDIAVTIVKTWPIITEVFDGNNGLNEPVPVLFHEEPEELRSKIEKEPDLFFKELNKFMTR